MFRPLYVVVYFLIDANCGHTQSFSCDAFLYKPLCSGTVGKCTCVVTGTTSSTRWRFFTPQGSLLCDPAIDLSQAGGQGSTCPIAMGTCGPYLRAANQRPTSDQGPCQTSTLNITADPHLNGVAAECRDLQSGWPGALIGNITIQIVGLPGSPDGLHSSQVCTNSLTIQWTPASGGYNASSYNISVTTVGTWSEAGDTTMTTIGDLIDGTNYTVSVTAINCAGSSNSSSVSVQTLPCAPVSVSVTTALYENNSVYDVELFWTHRQQSCSVPQYTMTVTSATSTDTHLVADTYCISSSCLYFLAGANVSSYNVSVACRNTRNQIGQPYVTSASVPTPTLEIGHHGNIGTIPCTFLDGSSHYCMVCCSTFPSVPPDSSVYNISTTRGTEVTVSLQGLTSGQMYYCKAAATNTNSNNCAGPVVGGVKVFFSMTMPASMPLDGSVSKQLAVPLIVMLLAGVVMSI